MTDARAAVAEHLRIAHAAANQWAGGGTNMPARHGIRADRLARTWPEMAALLDALVESLPSEDEQAEVASGREAPRVACPACGVVGTHIRSTPDPRTGEQAHRVQPCGHEVDKDTAMALWEAGLNVSAQAVDGAGLIRSKVAKDRLDKGRTRERDTGYTDGELAWGAWCILDRMNHPEIEEPPAMWPEALGEWKPGLAPLHALVNVGALIASEIDRLLAERERAEIEQRVAARA